MSNLAAVYSAGGHLAEAEGTAKRSLTIAEKSFSRESPQLKETRALLASILAQRETPQSTASP